MQQQLTHIAIPDDLAFTDLQLTLNADGIVSFDMDVIELICDANSLPKDYFWQSHRDKLPLLICDWYKLHRQGGGEPDQVAEDLYTEAIALAKAGQPVSYQSGRA